MKDFILDDHDHAVSVASLGVQLFTMPTIAHMLVAEEDVLARLLNTFLSECDKKLRDSKCSLSPSLYFLLKKNPNCKKMLVSPQGNIFKEFVDSHAVPFYNRLILFYCIT